jgi:hypothetical protein
LSGSSRCCRTIAGTKHLLFLPFDAWILRETTVACCKVQNQENNHKYWVFGVLSSPAVLHEGYCTMNMTGAQEKGLCMVRGHAITQLSRHIHTPLLIL